MGSLTEAFMADIKMNYVIGIAVKIIPLNHKPKFFCHYVVDCFVASAN